MAEAMFVRGDKYPLKVFISDDVRGCSHWQSAAAEGFQASRGAYDGNLRSSQKYTIEVYSPPCLSVLSVLSMKLIGCSL